MGHCAVAKAVDFAGMEHQPLPCLQLHLLDFNTALGSGDLSSIFLQFLACNMSLLAEHMWEHL